MGWVLARCRSRQLRNVTSQTPNSTASAFNGLPLVNNSSTASRLKLASYRFIGFLICWSLIYQLTLSCPLNQGNIIKLSNKMLSIDFVHIVLPQAESDRQYVQLV